MVEWVFYLLPMTLPFLTPFHPSQTWAKGKKHCKTVLGHTNCRKATTYISKTNLMLNINAFG